MSKKDYQAIARAIHGTAAISPDATGEATALFGRIVDAVADVLLADNPRFKRERFIEACETGTTKGMPKRAS